MAVIKYDELFDFPGYSKAIKDLEAANKEFGTTITAINDRISKQYKEIKDDLKAYSEVLKSFNVNQKGAADALIKTGEASLNAKEKLAQQTKIMQELSLAQELSVKSGKDLKTYLKALKTEFDSVNASEAKDIEYKKQIAQEAIRVKAAIAEQTNALKVTKTAMDAAEHSYAAMQQELTAIGKQLKAIPNAFDSLTGKINKNNKEAVDLSKRYLELNNSLKAADAQLGNFQRNVGNYSSAFKGFGHTIKEFGTDLIGLIGITSTAFFLSDSVEQALAFDKSLRLLQNTIKNVSGSAELFLRIKERIHQLTSEFKFLKEEDVADVFTKLIRYGKLSEDQINKLIPVIVDFATATGQDLSSATSLIIKSLEGNGKALKEFGINMKDAKSVTEGFSLVMDELKPRVDGVAKAFGESAAGKIAATKEEFRRLKEEIGTGLLPLLVKLLSLISTALTNLKSFGNAVAAQFRGESGFIQIALDEVEHNAEIQQSILDETEQFVKSYNNLQKDLEKAPSINRKLDVNVKADLEIIKAAQEKRIAGIENSLKEDSERLRALVKDGGRAQQDEARELKASIIARTNALQQIRASINTQPIGLGDPDKTRDKKTGGKSAEELENERIKKLQDALKAELDLRIKFAEQAREDDIIGERELQEEKLALIKEYVKRGIQAEQLKAKPDLKVIQEYNAKRIEAENDFKRFQKKSDQELKEDRLKQIDNEAANKIQALKNEQTFVLTNKKLTDKQREALELDYQNKIDQILIAALEKRQTLVTSAESEVIQRQIDELNNAIARRNQGFDDKSEKEAQDKRRKAYEDELHDAERLFDFITKGRHATVFEQIAQINKIYEIRKKLAKDAGEVERLEAERTLAVMAEVFDAIQNTANQVFDALSENTKQASDNRITVLENEKQKELDLAGNNAAAKEAIEKRYQQLINREKTKQAQREKTEAIFKIAIETAIGVARAVAGSPLTFGLPFSAFVLAQGILQAALVASKPLPKFKEGRKGGPATLARVDEAGPELIIDKTGKIREIGGERERITYLEKDTSVINAKETQRILKMTAITNEVNLHNRLSHSLKGGKQIEMIYVMSKAVGSDKNIEKAFEKAVSRIPIHQTIIDDKGQREREKTIQGTTTYLSNLTKN